MNTLTNDQILGQLNKGQRGMRLLVGSILILTAMFYEGPFGAVAILPLIAVYPIYTGIIGVDPIYLLWQYYTGVREEFNWVSRGLLIGTAVVLIGSVMAGEGELGWRGILALVAVYPALAAIIGKDPLNGFVSYPQDNVVSLQATTKEPVKVRKAA